MTSSDAERSAIEKLTQLIAEEQTPLFSQEEAAALKKFARVMLALSTFGSLGSVVRSVLVWIGILIALVMALKSGHLVDFFTSQGNSP